MAVHVRDAYAATHYNATTTAYAFGGTGAAGVWLQQYHVANHPPGTLCNGQTDPSGTWAWGTRIVMDGDVLQHASNNNSYYRRTFYLYDNGDVYCEKGMYWLDVHMGRYKTDAVQYGNQWRGYTRY
jgi:hypothetical protein